MIPEPEALWCLGLPLVGTAPLEVHERDAIRRRTQILVVRMLGYLAYAVGLPLVAYALFAALPATWQVLQAICVITGFFGAVIGAAAVVLSTLEGANEWRRLRRDRSDGEVLLFRGELPVSAEVREELFGGMPRPGADEIRVLRHAQAWIRPGRGSAHLQAVRIQHAAPPPSYAWRVALHEDLVPRGAPPNLRFEQRRLTPAEVREIVAYAQRLLVPGFGTIAYAFFLALIFAVRIAEIANDPGRLRGWGAIGELGPIALFGVVVFFYVRRVRLARRLRVDLRAGRAVTAVSTLPQAEETATEEVTREFLPVSGMTWTVAGRPAGWRDISPGARGGLIAE